MSKDMIQQFISTHDWLHDMFRNLPENIRMYWEVRNYQAGDVVCEQDMQVTYFYILVKGELSVERQLDGGISYTLTILQPGFVIGDIEISLDIPFINRVIASKRATLLALDTRLFKKWVMNDPYFLRRINYQMAQKLCQSGQKAIANNFYTVRHKLLTYFYEFLQSPEMQQQELYVLSAPREDIAKYLGVALRSVYRIIKDLKNEGVVSVKQRKLIFNAASRRRIEEELNIR